MKSLFLLVVTFFITQLSYAQWVQSGSNSYLLNGNVGIGTSSPSLGLLQINGGGDVLSFSSGGGVTQFNAYNNTDFRIIQREGAPMTLWTSTIERMRITANGAVGVGTIAPMGKLHISGSGTGKDGGNNFEYNGDGLIIQANTGARSNTVGAELEFVIPANTDGTNPWGQARIITVAGDGNSYSAVGKLILGTRRSYDKFGTGNQWYYGDDLVIDGFGRIGVGTLSPDQKLTVNGTIHSSEVKVDTSIPVPDYVFEPTYKLANLSYLGDYLHKYHHLPEIPSAAQIEKDGLKLGEMNTLLLKKVEELTLYLIEKDKQLNHQQQADAAQQAKIKQLEKMSQDQQDQIDALKQKLDKIIAANGN